jgi:hypothetical protein
MVVQVLGLQQAITPVQAAPLATHAATAHTPPEQVPAQQSPSVPQVALLGEHAQRPELQTPEQQSPSTVHTSLAAAQHCAVRTEHTTPVQHAAVSHEAPALPHAPAQIPPTQLRPGQQSESSSQVEF